MSIRPELFQPLDGRKLGDNPSCHGGQLKGIRQVDTREKRASGGRLKPWGNRLPCFIDLSIHRLPLIRLDQVE